MILLRSSILEHLDHDLACGIALGFFEHPRARVTLEAVTRYDRGYRVLGIEASWLGSDPLDAATRDYLEARRALSRASGAGEKGRWSSAVAARAREEALTRAIDAKTRARDLLIGRDAWARAADAGMTILE